MKQEPNTDVIRQCYYCRSDEGFPRPIGDYIVKLKEVETSKGVKLACQSCYLIRKQIKKQHTNGSTTIMNLINKLKKICFTISFLILLMGTTALAQGLPGLPGFPDNPTPAPIDGGLGLLAAAGGVYAYKKFKQHEEKDN